MRKYLLKLRCGVCFELKAWRKDGRGDCYQCGNARRREAYKKNPEKAKARAVAYGREHSFKKRLYMAKYYADNRDCIMAKSRIYYEKNRDIVIARSAIWTSSHPEVRKAVKQRRRAREASANGFFTTAEWRAIIAKQKSRCALCGMKCKLTVDHIIPLSRGGSNYAFNLQGLCGCCNASKQAKILPDAHPSLFDGAA